MTPDNPSTTPQTLEALEQLLRREPRSPLYAELAHRLCDAKKAVQALEVCRRGLANFPDDAAGLRAQGRALMLTGRLQEAQTELLAIIKTDRNDAAAMLLLCDVLLQKADPGRAKAMLQHATTILGKEDPEVLRLWTALGGMTGEINVKPTGPVAAKLPAGPPQATGPVAAARTKGAFGPLIGGKGAIINVVDEDVGLELGPVTVDPNAGKPAAGLAGRVAAITLLAFLLIAAGITTWRMRSRAQIVEKAMQTSEKALRTGSLARYRAARATVKAAIKKDPNNPDLHANLAKIEARMALEYMIKIKRVPAAIFAVEKIHRKLKRHPPSALRKLQARLGLAYRTESWGMESVLEARAIQQLLTGIKPRKGSRGVRDHTIGLLNRGIKKYPKALGLRYVRGLAHLANGSADKAERDLEETVKRDKNHVPAQLALAEVLLEQGRVVEAQERFNRVLGVNPTSLRARLGMIQSRLVRNRELTLVSSELRKLAPDKKSPRLIRSWYRLARAWLLWAQGKLAASSKALDHASQSLIPEARWLSWYIRLCLLLGEVDHSRRPLKHGLASLRSADDPIVQAFKLEVKLNQGLPEPLIADARKLLRKIGTKGPAARRSVLVLARAQLAAGRYDKALKALAALAKLKPEPADATTAQIYTHLARGLKAMAARQAAPAKPAKKKGKGGSGDASGPTPAQVATAAQASLRKLMKGTHAPGARYALAMLTTGAGQARNLLAGAVVNHRDAARAGVLYARLLIRADKLAEGRQQVEAAMERAPAFYPALRTRARLRLRTGHVKEALSDATTLCFAGYKATMPAGILQRVAHTARWSSRLSRLDRSTLCPSAIIQAGDLITRAEIYVSMERPDAIDSSLIYLAMGERLGANPGKVGVLRALSLLSGQQTPERGKQAEALLKALQKAHPAVDRLADYHYALGKALHSQNNAKAAVAAYQEALKRRQTHLATLRSLGWLLLGSKKNVQAAATFRKATVIAKRWEACPFRVRSRLQFALGQSLLSKGRGRDLKGAAAALTEALRLNGHLYQAAVALAKVHLATGRPVEARKQLEDVLVAASDYPDALLLLARLLKASPETKVRSQKLVTRLLKVCAREILSGRPDEGRFWLEQVLAKVDRKHGLARFMLGKLLTRYPNEGKRAKALLAGAGSVKPPAWLGPLLKKLAQK